MTHLASFRTDMMNLLETLVDLQLVRLICLQIRMNAVVVSSNRLCRAIMMAQ